MHSDIRNRTFELPNRVRCQMGSLRKLLLALLAFGLHGCAHVSQSSIPLDGAPVNDLSKVAVLVEDHDRPLLLRGLDGVPLNSMRVPSVVSNYQYLLKPGPHVLWVRDVPYGHPVIALFERAHCYVMEVELASGMRYRIKEDTEMKSALLLEDETGRTVAVGRLVDEPWIPERGCQWQ
jgi:hypothetical protein